MALLNPNTILPLLLAFVLGITLHEFAHAFVAWRMGDSLPKQQGRVTLNPLAHMSLWGTLMIFLIGFGWGKPVQHRIWEPRRRLWVALAGPLSNLFLALLFGLAFRAGIVPDVGPAWFHLPTVLFTIVFMNAILAVFNLLPLSPLDGASVLEGLLPGPMARRLGEYNYRYPNALIVVFLADFLLSRYLIGRSLIWTVLSPLVNGVVWLATGR